MANELSLNSYRKVRVESKNEAKMIGVLLRTGEPFKAVSKTSYYITERQCNTLSKNKIPYQKL